MNHGVRHRGTSYCLGIDGGGTKTLARLFRADAPEQAWQVRGPAASLTNDFDGTFKVIHQLVEQLLAEAGCQPDQVNLVAGLAGAGNLARREQLRQVLAEHFPFHQLELTTDARTSLYGAGQGEAVVCAALGTGSVAMALAHNGDERQCGGWGATFGDEGGASQLGKAAIKATLNELDQYGVPRSELAKAIAGEIGHCRAEILPCLAQLTPETMGQLAPHVSRLAPHCPVAQAVMHWHGEQVTRLIDLAQPSEPLPVVLTGGLAEATLPYLPASLQRRIQPARGTALDGACLLAQKLDARQRINEG